MSGNTYTCQEQPCTIHLVWGFFTLLRKRRSDKITRTWSWTIRLMSCSWNHPTLKPCRTNAFSLENAKISLRLDLPSTLIRWAFSLKTHRSENALKSGSKRKCIHIRLSLSYASITYRIVVDRNGNGRKRIKMKTMTQNIAGACVCSMRKE